MDTLSILLENESFKIVIDSKIKKGGIMPPEIKKIIEGDTSILNENNTNIINGKTVINEKNDDYEFIMIIELK